MDSLVTTVTKDWFASLNWSRQIIWRELMLKLFLWQKQGKFLFTDVRSERHLLGRLYGYVYAQTEGTGLSRRSRREFSMELVNELLMLPCHENRLTVYAKNADTEFLFGLAEGKRLGRTRAPLHYEDALYDALYETIHQHEDDNDPH